ncbi:lasso peptide biosynthesis B2 protein, partial [Frankia sp. CNm7]|nr:lasso peptide biosynthesis B2 protein [Frankia nepalensis]
MSVRPPAPQPPMGRRLRARLAVAAARALSTQPPARIRAVLAAASRGAVPATWGTAQRAGDDVTAVSQLCRNESGCLPRSVATALLCRMSGSWPTWRVGVRAVAPFAAHAWVEVDGHLVGESAPDGYFRPLMTVAPTRARWDTAEPRRPVPAMPGPAPAATPTSDAPATGEAPAGRAAAA